MVGSKWGGGCLVGSKWGGGCLWWTVKGMGDICGQVYYVSRCSLKTANKQYSNLKNDYEMTFNNDTVIERCDEDVDLPSMSFDFVPINEMEKHAANAIVGKDVMFCSLHPETVLIYVYCFVTFLRLV